MLTMKKILLILLLFPELAFAALPNYCSRFQLPGWWGSGEYLLVWRREQWNLQHDAEVGNNPKSGGRIDGGLWLTPSIGCGGTGFVFGEQKTTYFHPADNMVNDPAGHVETSNWVWGGDAYVRYRMLGSCCAKFDLLGGFRFIQLEDQLRRPMEMDETHQYKATNNYYSGLIGFVGELRSQCWAAFVTGKVGLGNMVEHVTIDGPMAVVNRGKYGHTNFEVLPEINAQLQLRLWPNFWVTAGYQYIFWPRILLARNQVSIDVDSTPHETSFWTQAFTTGIYFLY
ncbi:MAG: hypothetical protein S4CHLAM2_18080 [Chlamydiales bacterium]|nr:hypothetical protein [Chlamydiales bacterium]